MNLSAISLAINRPSQAGLPALNLDFAGTRSVDSRITFTRSSTATRFNSSGVLETVAVNTPRIDFDPVTGACLGLLIERQRTNLLLRSEEFENEAWVKISSAVTANTVVAPDGTLTGDALIENTANSEHHVQSAAITVVSGTSYTSSVYVKTVNATRNVRVIQFQSSSPFTNFGSVTFNPADGSIISGTGKVQDVGNGWFRVSVSGTSPSTGAFLRVSLVIGTSTFSYTGDGFSGIYIWGAQLEAGAFATSYIPTTSSQVTRSVDTAVMTGTNFSSWYRQDEGTLFAEASSTDFSANRGVIAVGDPTLTFGSAETMYFGFTSSRSGRPTLSVIDAGVSQASISATGTVTENTPIKMAAAYKLNDFASTFSGASPATDTEGTVPTPTGCSIGGYSQAWSSGGARLNGHIRRIAYWPTRLPNNQLQALTA